MRAVEPGSVLGRYEVGEELGSGGMATVYEARDTELRRDVAVKVLFPHMAKKREVVARFQREARAAASLDHPHILRVYDVGGGPTARPAGDGPMDPPYIVLELVRGGSLHEFCSAHEPPLAEVVAAMGAALCSALTEAHGAGIIHRDIKPANIMIAEGGRLVLSDFGVARLDDDSSLVTRTGAVLGTPAFMSPEQAHGAELDARSDVYSLGATLYKVATGSMPFGGPTPRIMSAIAAGELRSPLKLNPQMGRELARVIERMMATEPDERYPDAAAAAAALRDIVTAAQLGDPDEVLTAYCADPEGFVAAHTPKVVTATVGRARAAAEQRQLPEALALLDRVLALDHDNADALALIDRLGRQARRGRWLVAALAVAAIGAGGYVGYRALAGSGGSPAIASATADAAVADAAAADAVAVAMAVDARSESVWDAAVARTLPADARRRRVIRRPPAHHHPDAAVARTVVDAAVVVRAPPDAAPPPKPARVYLHLDAWCNVTVDGKSYGRASRSRALSLSPGLHAIVCSQGPGLPTWRTSIRVRAGETRTLTGSLLRNVRVRVAVKAGDGVYIHSHGVVRNGSSVALSPGRYRVELRRGGSAVQATWLTIPPVGRCTIKDTPELDCYR